MDFDPQNNFRDGFLCGATIAIGVIALILTIYLLNHP